MKPEARVLITRNMGLGDVLMVAAAICELKQRFPQARVTFATLPEYLPLLEGNSHIEGAVAIGGEPGAAGFDASADLCNWSETAPSHRVQHRADVFAEKLGLDTVRDRRPVYAMRDHERAWARQELDALVRPIVGLALRASTRVRTYPPGLSEQLIRLLVRGGKSVVLLDRDRAVGWQGPRVVDFSGRLGLRRLGAVIGEMDALVAPDTGLVHLAAAVDTPTVALFGTIPHALRVEGYPRCAAVQVNDRIGCEPCFDAGCAAVSCLSAISPEEIVAVLADLMGPREEEEPHG